MLLTVCRIVPVWMLLLVSSWHLLATRTVTAQETASEVPPVAAVDAPVDYVTQIKPILVSRCVACHGSLKQESGLRLDSSGTILSGGDSGPAVTPGASGESLLLMAVRGDVLSQMPPEGAPLTAEQIALIERWINEGAKAPEEAVPGDPRDHWSFQPPVRPAVPMLADGQPFANPIDAFVNQSLAQNQLTALPEADRATLLRRLYLDLTGLPPTRAELHAFVTDETPDAYEKVVDRLLASPRYGERWARHWMDVWRYSDWAGYGMEVRDSQRHIWRWRDWIMEGVNADKPYDQMIVEMLAADEVAPTDPEALRATGFLVRNYKRYARHGWMDAVVEHTGKAFLGLTFNCARCHDHMYDPIAQTDHYRLRAVFEPHNVRIDRLPGQPNLDADGVARAFDATPEVPTHLFVRGDDRNPVTDKVIEPGVPSFLGGTFEVQPVTLPAVAYNPGVKSYIQEETLAAAQAELAKVQAELATADAALIAARERAAQPAPVAETPVVVIDEDFATEKPELWEPIAGEWSYVDGHLRQAQVGDVECSQRLRADPPRDFSATFRFKITGGNQWRSVGLSFDGADGAAEGVYLSAVAGGTKLQVYHVRAAGSSYPAEGSLARDVVLDHEYTLQVDVRDQLVNVSVDGVLQLAYRMPDPRRVGKFSVWTFDAQADFLQARVTTLPADRPLAEPSKTPMVPASVDPAVALQGAEAAQALAAKKLASQEARLASLSARVAADRARYATPAAADAAELIKAACLAQATAAARESEEQLLVAEQQLAALQKQPVADDKAKAALTAAETAVAEKRKANETAQAAIAAPPADYAPLAEVYPATSTGRRTALARWIANRQNPLTARVAVNHIWLRHFGTPLVASVFDFGLNGRKPTHPELLDYLAVEFMEQGWSMKKLHRLIVTSAAYRRESTAFAPQHGNLAIDPDNHYLWRMNARRMEGESVRDSALYISGELDLTAGGPELDENAGLTNRRRSVYFRHAYEKQMVFLTVFDAASVNECYERNESIVPQQALALANSPLALRAARTLARQLSAAPGGEQAAPTDAEFVTAAFEQVLSRAPRAAEQTACVTFLTQQAELLATGAALTPVTTGEQSELKPAAEPAQRARENLVHVLFNHHDFVTIK